MTLYTVYPRNDTINTYPFVIDEETPIKSW